MKTPSRLVRAFCAWFGYSSVHFAAGRWRRGLVWIALVLTAIALMLHLPVWIIFAVALAQIADAALLRPARERSLGGYALFALVAACIGVLVAVTVRATWIEAFKIPAGSMIPALQVGDHILVDKTAKHPQRGEAAVFKYPRDPSKDFIKRVVAIGGDTVEIRDNQLILDGKPVPRVHVDAPCAYDDYFAEDRRWDRRRCDAWDETLDGRTYRVYFDADGAPHSTAPFTVPADGYFLVGDNRDNSHDSRFFGAVPQPLIKGVARKIWWSAGPDGVRWRRIDAPVR